MSLKLESQADNGIHNYVLGCILGTAEVGLQYAGGHKLEKEVRRRTW